MFGLVDANNFYASCQRVFDPSLINKPVVVLSNNDGCIVARSNEAKALGIQMGEPYFKAKPVIEKYGVKVFSSNYELYGDMSSRVMNILAELAPETEIYSIDECFLSFPQWPSQHLLSHGKTIRDRVKQWTGIPVSIGLAPTKTLAKAANKVAKKANGIQLLRETREIDTVLETMDVSDLWGVGRQYAKFLKSNNIHTALQLKHAKDGWVKKNLTIVGLRLVYELRGIPCLSLESVAPAKKAICHSRSFPKNVTLLNDLKAAVANFTARCGEKLRHQGSCAGMLQVFLHTNKFNADKPQYNSSRTIKLPVATHSTPELIHYALQALSLLYQEGYEYKKAGVIVTGIVPKNEVQLDLFDSVDRARQEILTGVTDTLNSRKGRNTVIVAEQNFPDKNTAWKMERNYLSPCYTTKWEELWMVTV
ncbi:Y-family DNA polymerase [Rhodocytophaga rosea]|uniref:Y-family DNA polymerase n=1 Tax=Rhodocytophaga rosea TaxID=2704465 RepID=A0A6C0GF77_9BACT|nr:Y-family DNA polymerase [Rhodocytophaga rosea]QHT66413.1 Y-family DNA polymerase [Rhodocytophaga rosea]